jgi:hypothetical protein
MTNVLRAKPPPVVIARALYNHFRWVSSGGRFGQKLLPRRYVNCDLDGVDFSRAAVNVSYFDNCSLRGARFVNMGISGTTFDSCDLTGTDFTGTYIEITSFLNCNYQDAIFTDSRLVAVAWSEEEKEQLQKNYCRPGWKTPPPAPPGTCRL